VEAKRQVNPVCDAELTLRFLSIPDPARYERSTTCSPNHPLLGVLHGGTHRPGLPRSMTTKAYEDETSLMDHALCVPDRPGLAIYPGFSWPWVLTPCEPGPDISDRDAG
jgi:hypothetical protein